VITNTFSPPGVYDFFVTYDSLGCTSESNHLIVTVNPTPDVASFLPADSACIGDVITLNGSGFTNVSAISFNGTPATSFAIVDDFTITVTVPTGATTGALSLTDGSTGCIGVSPVFTIKVICTASVDITAFIQGYYDEGTNGTVNPMNSPMFNEGVTVDPTDCDTMIVSLMDAVLFTEVERDTVILKTNGTATASYSSSASGNSYYIRLTHRNALETWSSNPVLMGASGSYNFSSLDTMAYGSQMVLVATGRWAMWSGDCSNFGSPGQDGFVESSDYSAIENDSQNFLFGYNVTDITGSGLVESADYGLVENNSQLFIISSHP